MSFTYSRNILVFFLVFTLIIFSAVNVSAECLVRADQCEESSTATDIQACQNDADCEVISGSCFDGEDYIQACQIGCCCNTNTDTYDTINGGLCKSPDIFSVNDYNAGTCTSWCSGTTGKTYTVSGTIKYTSNGVTTNVDGATVTLGSRTYTTNANGVYTFSNVVESSTQYTLTASKNTIPCSGTINFNANDQSVTTQPSTIAKDIIIQCLPVKISGTVKNSNNQEILNAEITRKVGGVLVTGTINTNAQGYYEFNVDKGSVVEITAKYLNNGETCTNTRSITPNVDSTVDITITCQKFTINVDVKKDGQFVTDATVSGGGNIIRFSTDNIYKLENVGGGSQTITATKTYISNSGTDYISTECTVSKTLALTSDPYTRSESFIFDNSNCCTKTVSTGTCTNGVATRTTRFSGSCAQADEIVQVPCDTQKVPCEWSYNEWSGCSAGLFEETRSLKNPNYIQTTNCDANLPRPEPLLRRSCGLVTCGNGIKDGSETCDYNIATGSGFVENTCVNTFKPIIANIYNIDPSIIDSNYITSDYELVNQVCNLYTCTCLNPVDPEIPPILSCQSDPSKLKDVTAEAVRNSDDFKIKWGLTNNCENYISNYVLTFCDKDIDDIDEDGETNECLTGTEKVLNNNIAKTLREYTHDGSINPKILPKTEYCYRLDVVYTATVLPGIYSSETVCFQSGDSECMSLSQGYLDSSWCDGNSKVSCNPTTNEKVYTQCSGDTPQCWFNPQERQAQCLAEDDCTKCSATFGIYSYMGYKVPSSITNEAGDNKYIYCPSYSIPNPNPDSTGGESPEEYIFGCYLDYSKNTINAVYDCKNVESCYDYKSEQSCEQDYCGKFTTSGVNGCEWNPLVTTGSAQNKYGKGVCAPKNKEDQQCGLCNDPTYNRISSSCTQDVCKLYGRVGDKSNCYLDTFSNECWNKDKIICSDYKDESSCNGAKIVDNVKIKKDVFVNVEWILGLNKGLKNDWNNKSKAFDTSRTGNVLDPSLDGGEVGLCKWDAEDEVCFRDADNSHTITQNTGYRDCKMLALQDRIKCELDRLSPLTTINSKNKDSLDTQNPNIPVYGLNMNLQGEVIISDNNLWSILGDDSLYYTNFYDWKNIRSFYCIDDNSYTCYPNKTIVTTGDYSYIIDLGYLGYQKTDNDKKLYLRYYSEDPARNLEVVKSMQFKLDALEPDIIDTMKLSPYQISAYQWRSDVEFELKLNQSSVLEKSMPVTCSFTLTPQTPTAAMNFEHNSNYKNNLPGENNPFNIIQNTNDLLKIKYFALSDGDYEYTYECIDDVGNNKTITEELTVEGDLRIQNPWPKGAVFNLSNTTNNKVEISIETENPGVCKYSVDPTKTYDLMEGTLTSQDITLDGKTIHKHKTNVDLRNPKSGIYRYYVACNFTDDYGLPYIVRGNDADNPYFSFDEIKPVSNILYKHETTNNQFRTYNYDINRAYTGLVLSINCTDNDNVLRTFGNRYMSFGCDLEKRYYCIPELNTNIDCLDISDYKLVPEDNSIELSYDTSNSQDKLKYGNNPTIFYYSVDKGGNIETYKFTKLNLRNTQLDNPTIVYASFDEDPQKTVVHNGVPTINYFSPLITITYDGESKINLDNLDKRQFNVVRIDDNSLRSYDLSKLAPEQNVDKVVFKFMSEYLPAGRYRLTINVTDDDGNINNYNSTFAINHSGAIVTLDSPILGIGTENPYSIILNTPLPSDCRYSFNNIGACDFNTFTSPLNCRFTNNEFYKNTITIDGYSHRFELDDRSSTDFVSGENELVYAVCKIRNTNTDNSNFAITSFHYGHLSKEPSIDVSYILEPTLINSSYNVIINKDKPWVTIKLTTNQPSVCRISMDHGSNILDVDASFDGESNIYNFDSYKLEHTYKLNYKDTGYDDGRSSHQFVYDVECTNLAQLKNSTQVPVKIEFDTTPPLAGIKSVSEYLTLKEYQATCDDHCTDKFQYKLIAQDKDCLVDTSAYSSEKLYTETISIVDSAKICIKVKDVLGRENITGFDITVGEFNQGLMSIEYPFEYSDFNGKVTRAYSPTSKLLDPNKLMVRTGTEDMPIVATCVYGLSVSTFASKTAEQIYNELKAIPSRNFDTTGDVIHSIDSFEIGVARNMPEAWIILCKAEGLPDGQNPYLSREVFFYWDDTNPVVTTTNNAKIYDWGNRLKTNIIILTDDDTMCSIIDQTFEDDLKDLTVDSGNDKVFGSYIKNRTYSYEVPSVFTQDINQVGDINLSLQCINRAKESETKELLIRYEIDKQVDATTNLDTLNVFGSKIVYLNVSTDIISTCKVTIDDGSEQTFDTTNRLNHTKTLTVEAGKHIAVIDCGADYNVIGRFTKEYELFVDLTPPTVQLLGPNSYNGQDTTCDLDGFDINVIMNDADSSIARYEYTISGDGIVSNYKVENTGTLNTIRVPPPDGNSVLKNDKAYTISVKAIDLANHIGGSSITIRTYNPVTGVSCDHLGPEVIINESYHTTTSKNYAIVNITCNDSKTSSTSTITTGCSSLFTYGFNPNKNDCSGVIYNNDATYNQKLIFFTNGTLCVRASDTTGNPTNVQKLINITPAVCGNGLIEKRIEPGYFGLTTDYDNWNWNQYDSLKDEQCDGTNLDGQTCLSRGFVSGTLKCSPSSCRFDTSSCSNGQEVKIVKPLPLGIGNSSTYTLTVNSQFDSECRYGPEPLSSTTSIVQAYTNSQMLDMTALLDGSKNHDKNIGPLSSENQYVVRYAICNMTNPSDLASGKTLEQGYGLVKIYEGFDTTAPIIESITTDKYQDKIVDINDRKISVYVKTNEDTICKISDTLNTVTDFVMYGSAEEFNSYSKSHTTTINYANLQNVPQDGKITLRITCSNKAGTEVLGIKDIYYDISEYVTIELLSPKEKYVTNYLPKYEVRTNVLSKCTINNGTATFDMTGTGLVHEKSIGIKYGWNNIKVVCDDIGTYAYPAYADYEIFGGANTPIGMTIEANKLSCSLSSITAKVSAIKTTLDIKHYVYSVTDLATSQIICSGTSTSGNITCNSNLYDSRKYIIEAYALDTQDHSSDRTYAIITASSDTDSRCDFVKPSINIEKIGTSYPDIIRLNVSCIDSNSGCQKMYYYSLIDIDQDCSSASYNLNRNYGTFDVTSSKNLCVKGYDNNNNFNTTNYTVLIPNTNYINLRPKSGLDNPKYVPPKLISTSQLVTNLEFATDINAICKYSSTPIADLSVGDLFDEYSEFDTTSIRDHIIESFNTQGLSENIIDVICLASSLPADQQYTRASYIVVYVNDSVPLNVTSSLNPNKINDWFNRVTELSVESNFNTVCKLETSDGQHDGLLFGNGGDYTTYAKNHYAKLEFDINTFTPSTYIYDTTCMDYIGREKTSRVILDYDLPTTLNITILSPLKYGSKDINIIASTDIEANCTLMFNNQPKGNMYIDVTGQNHIMRLTNISDGTYPVNITCNANINSIKGSIKYNVTIDTTIPPTVCGDGIVQKPNSGGKIEDCDGTNLNGNSCTKGFIGLSYIGGELRCKSDCNYDFNNCDSGKGWCGNGKLDGPNSNNFMEQCDGSIPRDLTCQSFGFKSGRLSCTNGCMINTSGCLRDGQVAGIGYSNVCSNKQLESNEQCEIGGNNTNIFCTTFGYDYGTISCGSNCLYSMAQCGFNKTSSSSSGSNKCGNGIKDAGEDCDRSVANNGLSTTSCKLINTTFASGNVSCSATCKYDFSSCSLTSSGSSAQLCNNSIKDTGESDIDCGGSCKDCATGKKCSVNGDCASNKCELGVCAENTCTNAIFDNSTETDIDCGKSCNSCALDKNCSTDSDCSSNYCNNGKCAIDPCSNGIKDGDEVDTDCGGSCMLCSSGSFCNDEYDCSSGICEDNVCIDPSSEPERNPAKLPVLISGLVIMLGSGGYIVYRTFYDTKPTSRVSSSHTIHGLNTPQHQAPHTPALTPEQQRAMLERQRQAIERRKQEREKQRKGLVEKLGDSSKDKVEVKSEEPKEEIKPKSSEEKTDEFVDISELKDKKAKEKEQIFSKLKQIGEGKDLPSSSSKSNGISNNDALKMFGKVDRDIVLSKAFREVLSKLLSDGKISKDNVSKILFEYMDKGLITKGEVAKISTELKII